MLTAGVTAGAVRFPDSRTDQVIGVTVQVQPRSWLSFGAVPGVGRTTYGDASEAGLTDLPLWARTRYEASKLAWSPSVWATTYANLPTSGASSLGVGTTSLGVSVGVGAEPQTGNFLYLDGSRSLTSGAGNGWIEFEGAKWVGPVTASISFSGEVGQIDPGTVAYRSVAGGVLMRIADPLMLTVDASRGLSASAPTWSFSVGVGTALAGLPGMGAGSPLGRLRNLFGPKLAAGSGFTRKPKRGQLVRGG